MFFWFSKIFWMVASPGACLPLLMLIGVAGLATSWRKGAQRLLMAALACFLLLTLGPVGPMLLRPLENRFPVVTADAQEPTGIIVLGGGVDEAIAAARGVPELNEAADRLTAAVALLRRFPRARLAFSGGSGRLRAAAWSEAEVARRFFVDLGVPAEQLTLEDQSRNTSENAIFLRDLLAPSAGERWWLITSASHMPRAVGAFRRAGFPVTAYPVDYATAPALSVDDFAAPTRGLRLTERAVREDVGLLAYWLTGRTDDLFPGPR